MLIQVFLQWHNPLIELKNYRKLVLKQIHPDPKISSAGNTAEGHYWQCSIIKVKENLKEVTEFNQETASDMANEVQNPEIRPEKERRGD